MWQNIYQLPHKHDTVNLWWFNVGPASCLLGSIKSHLNVEVNIGNYDIVMSKVAYVGLLFLSRAHILVQVMIYRRLRIGQDGHLDQSEAYDIS